MSLSQVYSAGLQIWEQGEDGLGNAHAGAAARANSAVTSYYNPAGMVNLEKPQLSWGIAGIYPDIKFDGSITLSSAQDVQAQGGDKLLPVPNFHGVLPFEISGHNAAVGFSVYSVFNAFTDYDDRRSNLENAADESSVKSINFGPTFAFEITDGFAVGGGVYGSYMFNKMTQGLYFFNQELGFVKNNFSGFGLGGNIGVYLEPNDDLRMGLTYFSPIRYAMSGQSEGFNESGATTTKKTFETHQTWSMPMYVIGSLFYEMGDFDLMATAAWFDWSRIQSLAIESYVPASNLSLKESTVRLEEGFHDTFSVMVGMNYHMTRDFSLKLGTGYDQSPTNDDDRNLQLPDSDRIMASTGVQYAFNQAITFDLAYMFIYTIPTSLDYQAPPEDRRVQGDVRSLAHVLGFQMSWKF